MSDSDDLFILEDPIFVNKELLEISHLPEEDRIVGRDEEIKQLANAINPAIFGQSPSNVLLYGKTGTGKSLCAKYVSRQLVDTAGEEGINAAYAYVDCAQDGTETQSVQTIADSVNTEDNDVYIPDKGISTATYYKRLWQILDMHYDVVLIILDEIDKLEDDDILMQLSRAGEAGKIENCKIGVIGISNKIKYKDRMDERVKSSLCEREFVFPPYDANQLNEIMSARSDAFREGVLEDGVIPRAAALAAREHGDARKAIDILRYAGEIAQSSDTDTVPEEFVVQARERAETDRFRELISGSTPHSRYVLQALTILSVDNVGNGAEDIGFRTTRVYDVYEEICRQESSDSLSLRRVRDLLKEHAFLDIIEQTRHSGGSAEGSYTEHQLLEDPDVVQQVLEDTIN
ncbi:AAA family ATPase [Haloarcula sp. JP-Z28]|uniref:ORC1-type DNA replication protein n=1 Tax=Haloarcula marismortui ATCC 33800 TaxID=662476 RepID=M0JL43_9EURY|nr:MULTISPECIES: orc1/cdc6 family replication initiation protein [Haloarcula]EMA08709.1 orc1/cdc6 family replication initiation protein [Haloarcula sinaiiensis ATCC 33800]NHN65434.1 AAA family ATPase [Haloarcula sp. JP-Z28]QUJ74032.1 orc1/cdc6 family replication initiation protein [Haloarcula sinaiiensis ATCC 33800]